MSPATFVDICSVHATLPRIEQGAHRAACRARGGLALAMAMPWIGLANEGPPAHFPSPSPDLQKLSSVLPPPAPPAPPGVVLSARGSCTAHTAAFFRSVRVDVATLPVAEGVLPTSVSTFTFMSTSISSPPPRSSCPSPSPSPAWRSGPSPLFSSEPSAARREGRTPRVAQRSL